MKLSKLCLHCNKQFHNHPCQTSGSRTWINKKYCSINCCNKEKIKEKTKVNCKFCNNEFETYMCKKNNRIYCSNECKYSQFSIDSYGSKNHQWRGDNVGYGGLHAWVIKNLGKPSRCENVDCVYPRISSRGELMLSPARYEWANKSHEYKRDISDWISLCPSCHRKYDMGYKRNLF